MKNLEIGSRVIHTTAGHIGTIEGFEEKMPNVYHVVWDHGARGSVSPAFLKRLAG